MSTPDFEALWQALPDPAMVLDSEGIVTAGNGAAEHFLAMSMRALTGRKLAEIAGPESRLAELIGLALQGRAELAEYNVELGWPYAPTRLVDISVTALGDPDVPGDVLIVIHPRAGAERMNSALTSRNAARSVVGMASMLAHEIKNPLAGISGAAQLLGMNSTAGDEQLTTLIEEECERISKMVSRVEAFGDIGLARRSAVNIHDVLDRAAKSAKAGFAQHVRFVVDYDPSLPPTLGDADQLMQVMLNLLKNAAEAAPPVGGVIGLSTSYRAGIKVATASGRRESLPLQITLSDNGSGIPEDMHRHIFEPFVTSKPKGSGLGLALVSKVVADHGGVISCESEPGNTVFRMLLPVASESEIETVDSRHREDAA